MTVRERTYQRFLDCFDRDEAYLCPYVVSMKMMVSSLITKNGLKKAIGFLTNCFGANNVVVYNQEFKAISFFTKYPTGLTTSIKSRIKKQSDNDFVLEYNTIIADTMRNILIYSVPTDKHVFYIVVLDNEILDEELKQDVIDASKIAFFVFFDHQELVNNLKYYSYVDALTGVKSRFLYKRVSRNLKKFAPEVTFVVCDLFSLKKINDNYGHPYGDKYLKCAAKYIEEQFPKCVYKLGGDEFIIIYPGKVDVDKKFEIVNVRLKKSMKSSLKKANEIYFINYGFMFGKTSEISAEVFYKNADSKLSENKKQFYSDNNIERRVR